MCNIVLFITKRSRIRCERPPTATRPCRIAEVELIEETHDPEGSQELALQRAHVVDLFSEFMRQLRRIDCTTRTHSTKAKTLF